MKYIFFDVNGVLLHSSDTDGSHLWTRNLNRDLGIDPADLTNAFFERSFPEVVTGRKDLHKTLTDILPEIRFAGSAKTLVDYWLENDTQLNQDTFDIIRELKQTPGKRLFLATHQEKNRANYLWHTLEFKTYFEEIFFSGRMGVKKTSPVFFNLIENDLSLTEADCLLIDNNPEVIQAAKDAGWKTILFTSANDLKPLIEAVK